MRRIGTSGFVDDEERGDYCQYHEEQTSAECE